jgi:hypothetical protein
MRRLLLFLVLLLLLVALLYAYRNRLPTLRGLFGGPTLPVDLQDTLPAAWTVVPNTFKKCDFDSDGEQEYLVIYRYDNTAITNTVTGATVQRTQIGGVVYDSQVNRSPERPGNLSPYRPAFLTPYRLLPDIYPGKGQGFLGESNVTLSYWPQPQPRATCAVSETAIFGYSDGSNLPTRLSLFRWAGDERGYLSAHFVGDARVVTEANPNSTQPIQNVYTYNSFNDRSQLCYVRHYRRQAAGQLNFTQIQHDYTIDFCYAAPPDPAYPEAVVVSTLRGHNPPVGGVNNTPTADSYFTQHALDASNFPAELAGLKNPTRTPYRILAISNPGTLTTLPTPGTVFTDTTGQMWVQGETSVPITATIELSGTERTTVWQMVSLANMRTLADVHWRVYDLGLR